MKMISPYKTTQSLKTEPRIKKGKQDTVKSTHVVYRACIASRGKNFRALALAVYDTLTLISKFQKGKSSEQY